MWWPWSSLIGWGTSGRAAACRALPCTVVLPQGVEAGGAGQTLQTTQGCGDRDPEAFTGSCKGSKSSMHTPRQPRGSLPCTTLMGAGDTGERYLGEASAAVAATGGNGKSLEVAGGLHEWDRACISLFPRSNDQWRCNYYCCYLA